MHSCRIFVHATTVALLLLGAAAAVAGDDIGCELASGPGSAPTGSIGSDEAIALALRSHPGLIAADCRVAAVEGQRTQAALRPNPEAQVELENFAGSGENRGFRSAETTAQLSQLIELGGKRRNRMAVADHAMDLERWNRASKRLDVVATTRKAYIALVAAQDRLSAANELVSLSNDLVRVVSARVRAGKVSPVEETRARVASTRTAIDVARAQGALTAAQQQLASQWGQESAPAVIASDDLEPIPDLPRLQDLQSALDNSPDVRRWEAESALVESTLALAESERSPDLTIAGGVRHFAEPDDVALVASMSLPIPLFDRNQGAISEARYRIAESQAQRNADHARLAADLQSAFQRLRASHLEVETIRDQVLPAATESLALTKAGYQYGKFGYADVIEAQRSLFEIRLQYIDALTNLHTDRAEIDRLTSTAAPLSTVPPMEQQ